MNQEVTRYPIYKGLKKPFVFKGYKGKYIYYVAVGLIGSIIIGGVVTSFSLLIGLSLMFGGIVSTLFLNTFLQKKFGLFNKKRDNDIIWVHEGKFNNKKKGYE